MMFPIMPSGGYYPFFDRQLRGVHLTDASRKKFILGVSTATDTGRQLTLQTSGTNENDGLVSLYIGGAAEAFILNGLRDSLTRNGRISYGDKWNDGLGWKDGQVASHPIRHAEMERRLATDEVRQAQRQLTQARLEAAGAKSWLEQLQKVEQPNDAGGNAWGDARRDLFRFYEEAAEAYGLLGPRLPDGENRYPSSSPSESN